MKKIVIALAAILVNAMFAPAASALPAFARQTGFSCSQCHFQHFPLLNAFGRSFKAGGYTMIGAQAKVEGDELSIPDRLNFGVLTTMGVERTSGHEDGDVKNTVNTPGGGGELSLFFGGRVSDNVGFLSELGTAGTAGASSAKMPMFYEVADGTRAGVVFMTTKDQGAAHSFETLNTGAVGVHRMVPMNGIANRAHLKVNSAAQYLATNTGAQGASFVVNNDHYFVNLGKYAVVDKTGASTQGGSMRMTYMRAAAMFDVSGLDAAVGVQAFRGDNGIIDATSGKSKATQATLVDGQVQGALGSMPLGVYMSYGMAPAIDANDADLASNLFNSGGVVTAKSMNIGAELGVVPGVATLMLAYRMANNGNTVDGTAATGNLTDNGLMLGVTYELAQNVETSLSYTSQSGSAWDVAAGAVAKPGQAVTTLMLEALF